MAGITLAQAEAKLTLWLAAEEKVAAGQSYEIEADGGRRVLRRADLAEIRKTIDYWNGMVARLGRRAAGRSNSRYLVN